MSEELTVQKLKKPQLGWVLKAQWPIHRSLVEAQIVSVGGTIERENYHLGSYSIVEVAVDCMYSSLFFGTPVYSNRE